MKRILYLVLLVSIAIIGKTQSIDFQQMERENIWVDSVSNSLTLEEKIGQLIVISGNSNKSESYRDSLLNVIKANAIGGLAFFQGDPMSQLEMTNQIQTAAKVPLLISIDAEWGLGMRLDKTINFPYQMALGAIQDNDLIFKMGEEIARQCRRLGIHINYAPVADINNNPLNPVINYRSFGEDKYNVAEKSVAYMKGMQQNGVIATAKHFPGHGDTETDSHLALPSLKHSMERMNELELYPFKELIKAGVGGTMVAHLDIPSFTGESGMASSLSPKTVTEILKGTLGFNGLVMTDALRMKGVADNFTMEQIAVRSFAAGNDLIVMPENSTSVITSMISAVKKGTITKSEIENRCKKILRAKFRLGLNNFSPLSSENLLSDLNTPSAQLLNRTLIENFLTLIENKNEIVPLKGLDTLTIATLSIGRDSLTKFQQTINLYSKADHFFLDAHSKNPSALLEDLGKYNIVLVGLHDIGTRSRNSKVHSDEVIAFVDKMVESQNVIISSFRNPYTLDQFNSIDKASALLVSYYDVEGTEDLSAQLIFGGIGAKGKLPVSIGNLYNKGVGIESVGGIRFKYTLPEEVGIDSKKLYARIDSISKQGIDSAAYPGSQILFAKGMKVFFYRSYGYHTYDKEVPVENDHLYDFASVTKISGGMPSVLKLHDEGEFPLEKPLKEFYPKMKWSNKANLDMRNILAHNAQLKAWIPYWNESLKNNGKWKRNTFSTTQSEKYPHRLSEELYMYKDYREKLIYKEIKKSDLLPEKKYVYSGLLFYLLPGIVENKTGLTLEEYNNKYFYNKLGATTLTYNPSRFFEINKIPPTELDTFFRKMQIQGVVHDEGAALMKGVSGNAGLFGNANDLAKLMQMYLNMGYYGGERFISEQTMTKFSSCQFCEEGNRRGLGFDRQLIGRGNGIPAKSASQRSFGHSGFTGTFTWVDPEYDLLYVFLSNRVYKTRENTKLYRLDIRSNIHQTVYDLIQE